MLQFCCFASAAHLERCMHERFCASLCRLLPAMLQCCTRFQTSRVDINCATSLVVEKYEQAVQHRPSFCTWAAMRESNQPVWMRLLMNSGDCSGTDSGASVQQCETLHCNAWHSAPDPSHTMFTLPQPACRSCAVGQMARHGAGL